MAKDLLVERMDVWAASIPDRPGGLAEVLEALRDAGADLQFVVARRSPEAPGKGVVFVTPLQSDREIRTAAQVGFNVTNSLHSLHIMGPNEPGVAAELTRKLATGGINLRGFSASVIGTRFVAYLALDSLDDANAALEILSRDN
ncbi:ACT domain-containing protein [Cupriavidus sp. WKF15]|uniref:ACT domain-containing protein n=1 Tax=Cupriavidus sp. WKF15 TaxID=3032282 RepID=UPI0023E0A3CC|nr:ACT domain-containing protein [Cupriavidus sp. WKF15]WER44478.1 ACT domain-containing protein [Cupriavidus sp. WKF15]